MDKFIRLMPMLMIVPIMIIMYMIVMDHTSLRAIALLCGLSAMSLSAAYYILQTRIRSRLIDPNKFMINILICGVIASLAFYFGFTYFHGR